MRRLPPLPLLPAHELVESFVKGSGPGGQKVNTTSSAVQLTHLPTGIVVKSQATRSREQNRAVARRILARQVDDLRKGPASRSRLLGAVARQKKKRKERRSRSRSRSRSCSKHEDEEHEHGEENEEEAHKDRRGG